MEEITAAKAATLMEMKEDDDSQIKVKTFSDISPMQEMRLIKCNSTDKSEDSSSRKASKSSQQEAKPSTADQKLPRSKKIQKALFECDIFSCDGRFKSKYSL